MRVPLHSRARSRPHQQHEFHKAQRRSRVYQKDVIRPHQCVEPSEQETARKTDTLATDVWRLASGVWRQAFSKEKPARNTSGGFVLTVTRFGSSSAFGESADMAFRAAFRELHLRSAIRARSNERLIAIHRFEFVLVLCTTAHDGRGRNRSGRRRRCSFGAKQLLLNSLLLPHPVLERDADCVRNRENLVRAKSDRAIRCDPAQLPVNRLD